jgi:uncharacterized cofD-like protein
VVALGGGHGLAATLGALRRTTTDLTAIVTVADDGGSSGRIRAELGGLPPGDLRMALAALAGEDDWGARWAEVFQHRFGGDGALAGHAVGNLVLAGLCAVTDSPVEALDLAARLLGAAGRVLPPTTVPLDIVATVDDGDVAAPGRTVDIRGQVAVATTRGRVCGVRLVPDAPTACPEAVAAVLEADWVVLGPGSLFTSVIPHLLVPDLAAAIQKTPARRLFALNLAPQTGETSGFSPAAHVDALVAHAPDLRVDVVLADERVLDRDGLISAAGILGADVVFADVAAVDEHGTPAARHDEVRLAAAYAALMSVPA